jgi:hypothetical protein
MTAPVAAAPQDQPASKLSTRTPKVTAPAASIKPVAPRPAPTRKNWGTVWTGWIDDPDADVNPCQKGLERGEQRQVKTYKSGDTTRYDVNYQCYLLVPAPRPAVASATPRKSCGTFWTGRIDDPDADVNPCPKGCEPGEQRSISASLSDVGKQYDVNYQCYVAGPAATAGNLVTDRATVALPSALGGRRGEVASRPIDTSEVSQPGLHSFELAGFTGSGTSLLVSSHSFDLTGFTASGTSMVLSPHNFKLGGFSGIGTSVAVSSHSFELVGWTGLGSMNKPIRRKK